MVGSQSLVHWFVARRISPMAVRIEKDGPAWTVIHDLLNARNAMDP